MDTVEVKEHRVLAQPLGTRWLLAALGAAGALGLLALRADTSLPAPRTHCHTQPDQFCADHAYQHLVNLTDIGPRVAGSYENEVVAVGAVVGALRRVAAAASPHHRLEIDVFTADGAFELDFLDGMNIVYSGVSGVVARLSARGAPPAQLRDAVLFNCHYDTVPDSPGAMDDGAACAVLLELARALAAGGHGAPRPALFLFNGAEENILQAAHGFVTRHRWAATARLALNLEAMGVGGRELVFQAAGRALRAYAAAAPRPFASSLAQELFRSRLVPADTDFRVFRDFGNMSGLDLAWAADGYAYHTRLDAASRVPPAALQRAGDNLLALARELLHAESLEAGEDGEPAFFDALGAFTVALGPSAAATVAALVLALVVVDLRRAAHHARTDPFAGDAWPRAVAVSAAAVSGACAAGLAAAVAVALTLAALDRRLAYYARPWLVLPLFAAPALAAAWRTLRALLTVLGAPRGWWRSRTTLAACGVLAAAALTLCLALGLRSGFLPALGALGAALAGVFGPRRPGPSRVALGAACSAPASLMACYLGASALSVLIPLAGRAGAGDVPVDVPVGAAVAALALAGTAWLLPLVAVARSTRAVEGAAWLCCGAALALVTLGGPEATYSAERPQRLMVFHARRTEHAPGSLAAGASESVYWIPALDDNTERSLRLYGRGAAAALGAARRVPVERCAAQLWCGAPYYLPVLSFVRRSLEAPAPEEPPLRVTVNVTREELSARSLVVRVRVVGAAHAVVLVSPVRGVRLAGAAPLAGHPRECPRWAGRRVYFFALHAARGDPPALELRLQAGEEAGAGAEGTARWVELSVAGHALFGPQKVGRAHAALLGALPAHVAATGWAADLHLYSL